jgi:hypothetical protein
MTVVPIDPTPEPVAGSAQPPSPSDLPAALLDAKGSAAPRPAPRDKDRLRRGANAATRGTEPAAAARTAGKSVDEVARASSEGHYDKVAALCGAGPISAERAPLCFVAACHLGDEPGARKLLAQIPAASRDRVTTACQKLGVDVAKPVKPAVDCEADPMACQH